MDGWADSAVDSERHFGTLAQSLLDSHCFIPNLQRPAQIATAPTPDQISMADPLSIASSVAGLLSTTATIGTVITNFISCMADVPDSTRQALSAVELMRLTLTSIRQLMDKLSHTPGDRKEMIHVRHLVIVFRETILSVSEVEATVCPAGVGERKSRWDNVKWLMEEEKILRAMQRLESHGVPLSTMLNTLQW